MLRRIAFAPALALFAATAGAKVHIANLFDLATRCDVVVHGKVTEVGEQTATIEVVRSFKRDLPPGPVLVTPTTRRTCVGAVPSFAVGDEVLVFLKSRANGPFQVIARGQGNVPVPQGDNGQLVEAAAKLVEIAMLNNPDGAMIALAASDNPTLREEACLHISGPIARANDRDRHLQDLVALLDATRAETRAAGLRGLQFIQAHQALPRMIALTEDRDTGVVAAASLALAQYDTEATVRALARLTRHESRHVSERATIDIGRSRRPEALEALLGLLDSPDAETRKLACSELVGWLGRREDGSFAARLGILMLEDAHPAARAAASKMSWEARDAAFVEPLVRLLRDARPGGPVEVASLEALRQIQRQGGDAGKRDVEAHLDLVRRSLRRGTGGSAPVEILGAANDVGELRWAAKEHRDAAVRGLAQCLLASAPR